jgi:addiction module HigA family antidote
MREILHDHTKLTTAGAARRMKVSRPALYAVSKGGAAVSADMALRFARLTGGAPELCLNMQTSHDLEAAELRLKDELASIEPAAVAARCARGCQKKEQARRSAGDHVPC